MASHIQETKASLDAWTQKRQSTAGYPTSPAEIAQITARVEALFRALYLMSKHGLRVENASVLDVGAASGYGLKPFLLNGFRPDQLHGIEMDPERVRKAHAMQPDLPIIEGDATDMTRYYAAASFDVVCEQFCFCHIPNADVRRKIANEMLRVVRPNGFILVHDWRMSRGAIYGVPQTIIRDLFRVGTDTTVIARIPSQLWPPIGRSVSKYVPGLYQLGWRIPALVGSRLTVLKRL